MNAQSPRTPKAELQTKIYHAFMAECQKQGGVKEPESNPWPNLPFYQVLDLLAAVAAEVTK